MSWRLLVGLCLLPRPLFADALLLHDGSTVQGSITSATAERIEVRTANGTMLIPRERITRIDLSQPQAPAAAPPLMSPRHPPPPYQEAPGFGPGSDMLTVPLGLSLPVSQVDFGSIGGAHASDGDVGVFTGVQVLHQLDRALGLGLEFDYAQRSRTDSLDLFPAGVSRVFGDSMVFLAEARWTFRSDRAVRPFVLAGLGGHLSSETVDVRPQSGFVWGDTLTDERRRLIDDSHWGAAVALRLGADFSTDTPVVPGFEVGWLYLDGSAFRATPAGASQGLSGVGGGLHIISVAARLGFIL